MEFRGITGNVVGIRLPNGKIKVIKSNHGHIGEVFESEELFYRKFQNINESGVMVECNIIESINE